MRVIELGATLNKFLRIIVFIFILASVAAYFVNSHLKEQAKKKAEEAEKHRIEKATNLAIAEMIARTNAIDNWAQIVSKGRESASEKLLTIDLEKVWKAGRPILFKGNIQDISTMDNDYYLLEINRSIKDLLSQPIISTRLQLALKCSKNRIDMILKDHPQLVGGKAIFNGVAVVANIENIETKLVPDSDNSPEEIKVGKGQCVDILFIGEMGF